MKCLLGVATASLLLGALLCAACIPSIGPRTIPRDRFDYGATIARAKQEQLLSNLVRARYGDGPVFLEVSSIINQYALEGELTAGGSFPGLTDRDSYSVGGRTRYSDRPTITYAPLSGDKFIRSLLTPLRPETLFSMMQAGWPVDVVFYATVRVINGVHNRSRAPALAREPDPEFVEMLAALRRIQLADAFGFRMEGHGESQQSVVVFHQTDPLQARPDLEADARLVRGILGLDLEKREFRLHFGSVPETDGDIAILTRSMIEMMAEMAASIEVPAEHVAERRALPTNREQSAAEAAIAPLMRVQSSSERPEDAAVSVHYRDHWFWIDDRDIASKRVFQSLMIFFELAQTGAAPAAPLVTIGAGG